jgi:DNA-binding NarL/FixJ family response regulator
MMGPRRRRILIVDDHDVVHWGFRLLFSNQPWVERCISAKSADDALQLAVRYEPHVALVDLFVGAESGAEICTRLRERLPQTRVLLISGAGRITASVAKAAGASGFISKDASGQQVARAAQLVSMGMLVFPPQSPDSEAPGLSERERQVLTLVATGATNREIASELHLSPHTVKEHTSTLYRKLSVRNRAEAVQRAQRLGLLT